MRRTSRSAAGRGGFTLIELLVAAALALVVMTVLSLAFQAGMQTLSSLKSVVGMAEQLRTAEGVMRADLAAQHLEDDAGNAVKLSVGGRATKGYLSFTQGGMASTKGVPAGRGINPYAEAKGAGENGVTSTRTQSATRVQVQTGPPGALTDNPDDVNPLYGRAWMDYLAMTVKLSGDRPQDVFTAPAESLMTRLRAIDAASGGLSPETRAADPSDPKGIPKQLTSRWAEVAYFLKPASSGGGNVPSQFSSDDQAVPQLPLYTLYRRQRVLVERNMSGAGANPPVPNFTTAEAQKYRQVAMAAENPAGSSWAVLGPEAVSGVTAVPADWATASPPITEWEHVQPNGSVIRSRYGFDRTRAANRLGGANDLLTVPALSPGMTDVSAMAASPLKDDLQRRPYAIPFSTTPDSEYGADVLVTNVLSMTIRPVYEFDVSPNVRAAVDAATAGKNYYPVPKSLAKPQNVADQNAPADWLELYDLLAGAEPTGNLPGFPRSYDTAGPSKVGVVFRDKPTNTVIQVSSGWDKTTKYKSEVTVRLKALEIKLRVYDQKNQTTRQMTVLQDL